MSEQTKNKYEVTHEMLMDKIIEIALPKVTEDLLRKALFDLADAVDVFLHGEVIPPVSSVDEHLRGNYDFAGITCKFDLTKRGDLALLTQAHANYRNFIHNTEITFTKGEDGKQDKKDSSNDESGTSGNL